MSDTTMGPSIAIVKGSVRPGNFTSKAVALVEDEFRRRGVHVTVLDPGDFDLALPGLPAGSRVEEFQALISRATGVVLATPEYHGTFSSVMKLAIENMSFPSALAGKPVALLGVAAGQIGAIKALEHLRSVASHVGAIVLPGPVSVARVREVFDEAGRAKDRRIEARVRQVATHLLDYIEQHLCPKTCLEAVAREDAA